VVVVLETIERASQMNKIKFGQLKARKDIYIILITNADRIEIYPLDNLGRSTALHCIALREEGERRRFQIYKKILLERNGSKQ
jgi:hypothetical protein